MQAPELTLAVHQTLVFLPHDSIWFLIGAAILAAIGITVTKN
jgi:hypothetical protein